MIFFKPTFLIKSLPLQQEFFERLYVMYTVGYSISFGSLVVAILIIGYFRWAIPILIIIHPRHGGLTICVPKYFS